MNPTIYHNETRRGCKGVNGRRPPKSSAIKDNAGACNRLTSM